MVAAGPMQPMHALFLDCTSKLLIQRAADCQCATHQHFCDWHGHYCTVRLQFAAREPVRYAATCKSIERTYLFANVTTSNREKWGPHESSKRIERPLAMPLHAYASQCAQCTHMWAPDRARVYVELQQCFLSIEGAHMMLTPALHTLYMHVLAQRRRDVEQLLVVLHIKFYDQIMILITSLSPYHPSHTPSVMHWLQNRQVNKARKQQAVTVDQ